MIDTRICEWLMENADAPIRYRVAREFLKDASITKKIESDLLENATVKLWLKNLKPEIPPQHRRMTHGSFDFCLENAALKIVQLGLHAGLPQVVDAVSYYMNVYIAPPAVDKTCRKDSIIVDLPQIATYLTLIDFQDRTLLEYMLERLDELYGFVRKGDYDIYLSDEERNELKGIPLVWNDRRVIKKHLFNDMPAFPIISDIVALHKLYRMNDTDADEKIDAVIKYISTDEFHEKISDGYGIVICDNKTKYYSMGWDPKYPGWFNVAGYMEAGSVQKLLFFAEYIAQYPAARITKWFQELLGYFDKYKTYDGTYLFPKEWLRESQGYAVMGSHISFGENRRKKNWAEIESTFYMQLISQNI